MKKSFGFTLIELLIVIAIIGILVAVLISVLDPAKQRRKAQESVAKANLGKVCLALSACQTSLSGYDSAQCDSASEVGVTMPTEPSNATYTLYDSAGNETLANGYVVANARFDGGTCRYICLVFNDFRLYHGYNPGMVHNFHIARGEPTTCVLKD